MCFKNRNPEPSLASISRIRLGGQSQCLMCSNDELSQQLEPFPGAIMLICKILKQVKEFDFGELSDFLGGLDSPDPDHTADYIVFILEGVRSHFDYFSPSQVQLGHVIPIFWEL